MTMLGRLLGLVAAVGAVSGCAGETAEMQRARTAAARQLECGDGVAEVKLVKTENGLREYEVGCDFSLVRVTCENGTCAPVNGRSPYSHQREPL